MSKLVVLVEDEVNIAEAIRFLLGQEGWRVETLANGSGAVEVIRKASPDLVMLDVMLPGKSGFEILDELRGDPAMGELPVLMLTARGQSRDRAMAEMLVFAGADVEAVRLGAGSEPQPDAWGPPAGWGGAMP